MCWFADLSACSITPGDIATLSAADLNASNCWTVSPNSRAPKRICAIWLEKSRSARETPISESTTPPVVKPSAARAGTVTVLISLPTPAAAFWIADNCECACRVSTFLPISPRFFAI
ncbi:hypothetical protein ACVMIL_010594 [Bradyrhizobium barranii subsp. barranii]